MQLEVRLDRTALRRWHVNLVTALTALPSAQVRVEWSKPATDGPHRNVERLFAVERRLQGLRDDSLGLVDASALNGHASESAASADVVLDLTGGMPPESGAWRLTFDGTPGEAAAIEALRSGRMPLVSVVDSTGQPIATGRPGSERPGVLVGALEDLLAGAITLVTGAVQGSEFSTPVEQGIAPAAPLSLPREVAKRVVGTVAHRGYRTLYRAPHWRVGWRFVDGPDVLDLLDHPESGWRDLPDDGYHFYADPFPFEHEGRLFLFVEDFDHRVGKGVISVVDYDDHGPVGAPRPVLSHDVHLSYPCVLEHDGDVWMIPETCAAGTVELYRATRFPDAWERHSVLLEGLEASDVTPFVYGGRWWLAATVRNGGSFSDALHLWHADDLRGPWTPHAANPVLVDIASARPAGRVVHRDGRLLRPTQDGRGGYGASLTITEVTELDERSFAQTVVAEIRPGERWPGRRLHTLNRAGRLETIDGSAMSPRAWPRKTRKA